MSSDEVTVRPVAGSADLDHFVRLPWRIYENDPCWVPPLLADVRGALDLKHPFHAHAEMQAWLAWQNGQVAGRVAAIINRAHNDFYEDRLGFFGLFECVNDTAVSRALLEVAEAWLRERGISAVQGPVSLSTNEEISSPGVLIEGNDTFPVIMMGHTPAWYAGLLEDYGYAKAKDLLCYWADGRSAPPERFERGLARMRKAHNVVVRSVDMKRFNDDVAIVQDIYNSAWEKNWGFIPMTPAEIAFMAKHLKPVINPSLCPLAFIDGKPVAFALALPDYNQALRHLNGRLLPFGVFKLLWYRRKIDAVRVITLGVLPEHRQKGIDSMLIAHIFQEARKINMAQGECSWILEDNWPMRRGIERIGGSVYKTYRVYEKALEA